MQLSTAAAIVGIALAAVAPQAGAQAASAAAQPPRFRVTLLASPTGSEGTVATGVNERGQVIGLILPVARSEQIVRAGFWADAHALPVQATGSGAEFFAQPHDLDDSGLVVGNAQGGDLLGPSVAFTWTPGQDVDPVASPHGGCCASVAAINERGVMAGSAGFPVVGGRPTRWIGGVPHDLGLLPGDEGGTAHAISERGHVVGRSGEEAALWFEGTIERLDFPGTTDSRALDVNDRGVAVGQATTSSGLKAVLWRGPNGIELPTLGGDEYSIARNLNNHAWIVGATQTAPPYSLEDGNVRAALWIDGRVFDLNALTTDLPIGAKLTEAYDVNDAGQIVGAAMLLGMQHAFLLDPIGP